MPRKKIPEETLAQKVERAARKSPAKKLAVSVNAETSAARAALEMANKALQASWAELEAERGRREDADRRAKAFAEALEAIRVDLGRLEGFDDGLERDGVRNLVDAHLDLQKENALYREETTDLREELQAAQAAYRQIELLNQSLRRYNTAVRDGLFFSLPLGFKLAVFAEPEIA